MSDASIADWLGGVGQAVEALFVVWAFLFARGELKSFMAQRELGHEEAKAKAAVEVWDTVVVAVDTIETVARHSLLTRDRELIHAQLARWGERSENAIEGVNRSIGRAVLLLGATEIYDHLMVLNRLLNDAVTRGNELGVANANQQLALGQPLYLCTTENMTEAQTAQTAILRKLNAVALRQTPASSVLS